MFRGPGARLGGGPVRVLLVLATSEGGIGRHVAAIAAGLAHTEQLPVRVAGPAGTEAFLEFSGAGVSFDPVDIASRPRPAADWRAVRRLRELAAGTEVVHAHGLRAGALAVLAVRGWSRRHPPRPAIVVTVHNALVSSGVAALIHRALEWIVARGADVVLVVSDDLGTAMRRRGARDVRLAVVAAPLLSPARRPAADVRRELGAEPGTALLVTVARLAPQKGLDILLDAIATLAGEGRTRVRAAVAGDGPLAGSLADAVADRGLPVALLGGRSDVSELLAAADVVVVASRWEGQSLIVQEALRAGAAICATDVGGTAELTQGAAVLVRAGDSAELAAAIGRMLADPAALTVLRQHARMRGARLLTVPDAVRDVISVYHDVLHQPSPDRRSSTP